MRGSCSAGSPRTLTKVGKRFGSSSGSGSCEIGFIPGIIIGAVGLFAAAVVTGVVTGATAVVAGAA